MGRNAPSYPHRAFSPNHCVSLSVERTSCSSCPGFISVTFTCDKEETNHRKVLKSIIVIIKYFQQLRWHCVSDIFLHQRFDSLDDIKRYLAFANDVKSVPRGLLSNDVVTIRVVCLDPKQEQTGSTKEWGTRYDEGLSVMSTYLLHDIGHVHHDVLWQRLQTGNSADPRGDVNKQTTGEASGNIQGNVNMSHTKNKRQPPGCCIDGTSMLPAEQLRWTMEAVHRSLR